MEVWFIEWIGRWMDRYMDGTHLCGYCLLRHSTHLYVKTDLAL